MKSSSITSVFLHVLFQEGLFYEEFMFTAMYSIEAARVPCYRSPNSLLPRNWKTIEQHSHASSPSFRLVSSKIFYFSPPLEVGQRVPFVPQTVPPPPDANINKNNHDNFEVRSVTPNIQPEDQQRG